MINSESISLIESAISDTEAELRALDQIRASAAASQETIKRLENDIADLGANKADLEQKVRASRLTGATSLLTLERGDLVAFNSQIDDQIDRVVQFSGRAIALLQELWSCVLAARKADVEKMVRANFDLTRFVEPIEMIAAASYPVIEVTELEGSLFIYRSRNDRDGSVVDARALRDRAAPLIAWAKDLPDLKLDIRDPGVKPAVKPPAANTLAAPMFA
jgi:hypothetical protein